MTSESKYTGLDYLTFLFTINLIGNLIIKYNKDSSNQLLVHLMNNLFVEFKSTNIQSIIMLRSHTDSDQVKKITPVVENSLEIQCLNLTIKYYYLYCHTVFFQKPSSIDLFKKLGNLIFSASNITYYYVINPIYSSGDVDKINFFEPIDCQFVNSDSAVTTPLDNIYFGNSFTLTNSNTNSLLIGINSCYSNTFNFINLHNTTLELYPVSFHSVTNILVFLLKLSKYTDNIKTDILGKNGLLTEMYKTITKFNLDERKVIGNFFHKLKTTCINIFELLKKELEYTSIYKSVANDKLDITLPIHNIKDGGIHPLTKVTEDVVNIFKKVGFNIIEGPEIENNHNNFTALNFDDNHPAKNAHDTFYFSVKNNNNYLLRTHTSSVQIRAMQSYELPIQFITTGRVYRCDSDATHTPMFHQLEGLYINKETSVAELKGLLVEFCEKFFNIKNICLRFRPSYFPFTSPSLEVDISCRITKNKVFLGETGNWLEILGCGMLHPNVLKNCNIDSNKYTGFAFGMGLERLAMLKYGFPDIREFFNSNNLWLKSYKFKIINSLNCSFN